MKGRESWPLMCQETGQRWAFQDQWWEQGRQRWQRASSLQDRYDQDQETWKYKRVILCHNFCIHCRFFLYIYIYTSIYVRINIHVYVYTWHNVWGGSSVSPEIQISKKARVRVLPWCAQSWWCEKLSLWDGTLQIHLGGICWCAKNQTPARWAGNDASLIWSSSRVSLYTHVD